MSKTAKSLQFEVALKELLNKAQKKSKANGRLRPEQVALDPAVLNFCVDGLGEIAFKVGGSNGRSIMTIRSIIKSGLFSATDFTTVVEPTSAGDIGSGDGGKAIVQAVPFFQMVQTLEIEKEDLLRKIAKQQAATATLQRKYNELARLHQHATIELEESRTRAKGLESQLQSAVAGRKSLAEEKRAAEVRHSDELVGLEREVHGFRAASLLAQNDLQKLREDRTSLDGLKKSFAEAERRAGRKKGRKDPSRPQQIMAEEKQSLTMYQQLQILHDARMDEYEKTYSITHSKKARMKLRAEFHKEMDSILDEEYRLRKHLYNLMSFGSRPRLGAGQNFPFEYPITLSKSEREKREWPADPVALMAPNFDRALWKEYKARVIKINGRMANADQQVSKFPVIPPWGLHPFTIKELIRFISDVYTRAFATENLLNEFLMQDSDKSIGAFVPGSRATKGGGQRHGSSRRMRKRTVLGGDSRGARSASSGDYGARAGGGGSSRGAGSKVQDGEVNVPPLKSIRNVIQEYMEEKYGCERVVATALHRVYHCTELMRHCSPRIDLFALLLGGEVEESSWRYVHCVQAILEGYDLDKAESETDLQSRERNAIRAVLKGIHFTNDALDDTITSAIDLHASLPMYEDQHAPRHDAVIEFFTYRILQGRLVEDPVCATVLGKMQEKLSRIPSALKLSEYLAFTSALFPSIPNAVVTRHFKASSAVVNGPEKDLNPLPTYNLTLITAYLFAFENSRVF